MKILHQLPLIRCGLNQSWILRVHLQAPNMLKFDVKQLLVIEMQDVLANLTVICLYIVGDFLLSTMAYLWIW
jgi:hypothetical protein